MNSSTQPNSGSAAVTQLPGVRQELLLKETLAAWQLNALKMGACVLEIDHADYSLTSGQVVEVRVSGSSFVLELEVMAIQTPGRDYEGSYVILRPTPWSARELAQLLEVHPKEKDC